MKNSNTKLKDMTHTTARHTQQPEKKSKKVQVDRRKERKIESWMIGQTKRKGTLTSPRLFSLKK